jgi:hypothetical protein
LCSIGDKNASAATCLLENFVQNAKLTSTTKTIASAHEAYARSSVRKLPWNAARVRHGFEQYNEADIESSCTGDLAITQGPAHTYLNKNASAQHTEPYISCAKRMRKKLPTMLELNSPVDSTMLTRTAHTDHSSMKHRYQLVYSE